MYVWGPGCGLRISPETASGPSVWFFLIAGGAAAGLSVCLLSVFVHFYLLTELTASPTLLASPRLTALLSSASFLCSGWTRECSRRPPPRTTRPLLVTCSTRSHVSAAATAFPPFLSDVAARRCYHGELCGLYAAHRVPQCQAQEKQPQCEVQVLPDHQGVHDLWMY